MSGGGSNRIVGLYAKRRGAEDRTRAVWIESLDLGPADGPGTRAFRLVKPCGAAGARRAAVPLFVRTCRESFPDPTWSTEMSLDGTLDRAFRQIAVNPCTSRLIGERESRP